MASFAELDALSSDELHDRAVKHAVRHADVKFLWSLLEEIPAAEAVSGDVGEADTEVWHASSQVEDAVKQSPGVKDALRPVYIDYLEKHPDA